jgi:ribosomal protein S18 acetylase RimI-like enzyme
MTFTIEHPTEKDFLEMDKYAIMEFGVPDENMVVPNLENDLKIQSLEKNNFVCYKKDGLPIAWSVMLPTSKNTRDRFLKKEINEKQMLDEAVKNPSFESVNIFAVIVLPEYRQQGLAKELLNYQIKYFQDEYKVADFFAWIFSPEGEKIIKSLEKTHSIRIEYISKV